MKQLPCTETEAVRRTTSFYTALARKATEQKEANAKKRKRGLEPSNPGHERAAGKKIPASTRSKIARLGIESNTHPHGHAPPISHHTMAIPRAMTAQDRAAGKQKPVSTRSKIARSD